jgi:uncharacterized protein YnzC (UPF0291/DUF896 family)
MSQNRSPRESVEVFELSRHENLAKEYMTSHKEDIDRRVDVLILYIDSFRKIFNKNLSTINQNLIRNIEAAPQAVKERNAYVNNYLNAIKEGFKNVANNMFIVKQDHNLLVEVNLKEYDRHDNKEFTDVSNAFLKTAADVSALGRAFGKSFITSSWDGHAHYNGIVMEFNDTKNMQDRYLVDISFYDNIGYSELSIISFFKIGG